MDPRKLLQFAVIVEHGSLKKAAQALGISQPALSTAMDRFELSLGASVLERGPLGISLTALGEALHPYARAIREDLDLASRRVTGKSANEEGVIVLGALPSLVTNVVPKAVIRWRETHPSPTLKIIEKNQLDLLKSLLRGEVDFVLAQTEYYGMLEGMRQRVLFRDRLQTVCRPGHPALALSQPTWAQLATFPWTMQMIGRQRTLLEKLLAAEGCALPDQLTECSSVAGIKSLVIGSEALALLPASAIATDLADGKITPIDITDAMLNRDIAVLTREGGELTPAAHDLIDLIMTEGAEIAALDAGATLLPPPGSS